MHFLGFYALHNMGFAILALMPEKLEPVFEPLGDPIVKEED